jgi:hypothetical protein
VAYFDALFRYSSGGTKENHEDAQFGWSLPDGDEKTTPPEYISEPLPLEATCAFSLE